MLSLKLCCHLSHAVTPVTLSLKLCCHSSYAFTQDMLSLKLRCHSSYAVTQVSCQTYVHTVLSYNRLPTHPTFSPPTPPSPHPPHLLPTHPPSPHPPTFSPPTHLLPEEFLLLCHCHILQFYLRGKSTTCECTCTAKAFYITTTFPGRSAVVREDWEYVV